MRAIIFLILPLAFATGQTPTNSVTDEGQPLWEFGLGVVGFNMPDYPGANHNRNRIIPFPSFIYRGKIIRSEDSGEVRGRLLKGKSYEFSFSIGGSLPANSEDNPTREGMPDLDLLFEIGPSFIWRIIRPNPNRLYKLDLHVPVRFIFSTDIKDWTDRGLTLNPIFIFRKQEFIFKNTGLYMALSARWATERTMEYFYNVEQEFVRPGRGAYQSTGGYLVSRFSLGFNHQIAPGVFTFGGIRYSNLDFATNKSSPLLVKTDTLGAAIGLSWWFSKSDKMADPTHY